MENAEDWKKPIFLQQRGADLVTHMGRANSLREVASNRLQLDANGQTRKVRGELRGQHAAARTGLVWEWSLFPNVGGVGLALPHGADFRVGWEGFQAGQSLP